MKTVLIVSHRQGFEADPIIDELRRRNVPVFRFNADDGKNTSLLSMIVCSSEMNVEFFCDGRNLVGSDIGVGWCQQLPPYLGQAADEVATLQHQNLWAAEQAVYNSLCIPWLNQPRYVLSASNKIVQLIAAKTQGLQIPVSLISNHPKDIKKFCASEAVVVKNLATPWILSESGTRAAFTRIVQDSWLQTDADLEFCPAIYQIFHERKRDYRVVVVGSQMFVVSSYSQENQREDIRRASATGETFEKGELPTSILNKLSLLLKQLGLQYCAADFIEDTSGNILFLEINTCGSWWWVDRLHKGAICKSIADYLESANNSSSTRSFS